jgi:hypothetical protein
MFNTHPPIGERLKALKAMSWDKSKHLQRQAQTFLIN